MKQETVLPVEEVRPLSNPAASRAIPCEQRFARLSRIGWILLFMAAVGLYLLRQIYDGPYGKDFTIFLTGAHIVGTGQLNSLYDLSTQTAFQTPLLGGYTFPGGLLPFNYPPYVAFFLLPLSFLSAPVAYYVWLGLQLLLLVAWAVWVVRTLREWGLGDDVTRLSVLAVLGFQPVLEALLMGQMSFITVVLWWWALVSWKHERWGQLGVAVALAAFKPQMAVLLVIALVAQKRWRSVAYLFGAELVLWAVALLLGGTQVLTGYLDMLRVSASTVGTLGFYPASMENLRGVLTIVGLPESLTTVLAFIGWVASMAATFVIWRLKWPLLAQFGLTAVLAVFFSPHLYIHDASLLVVGALCAIACASSGVGALQRLNRLLLPFALVWASLYVLVLGLVPSYVPLILSVLLLCCVLVAFLVPRREVQLEPSQASLKT
jgi:hypothetical protein